MKIKLAILAALLLVSACSMNKEWVQQDRDTFATLDDNGLDRWIDNDPTLSKDKKEALHILNDARRARIKRGCEAVGIPYSAAPTGVSSVAQPVSTGR